MSHTFIEREIEGLRARGTAVDTFSVRPAAPEDLLTDADRRAAEDTFVVLPPDPRRFAPRARARAARRPGRYAATLARVAADGQPTARATRSGSSSTSPRRSTWPRELERRGVHHVHAHFANVASAIALLIGRLGGAGLVVELHDARADRVRRRDALPRSPRRCATAAFVACIGDYAARS